jgi:predicted lactoylglutathione lyase
VTVNPLLVSLPIADRSRSYAFYQEALGLEPVGELADDGVPEPLMFRLNEQTFLMLIPTEGFGWVVGDDHQVATPGTVETVLGFSADSDAAVDQAIERARAAGASISSEPAPQPWGYASVFADPDGHLWSITSAKIPI